MEFKLIVIAVLALSSLYRLILNIVQFRSAKNPIPSSVSDVYDEDAYFKWRKYNADRCRLGIITTAVTFVVQLIMLVTNAYAAFASLFSSDIYVQLIAVILLDTAVSTVVTVGFDYYETMVIEEKYGFNRSTVKTFVTDKIRNLILELVIGIGLASLLASLHQGMGNWLILLFAGVVFVITLLISFLYPVFSRMGNKFVPLEEGELKDKLMGLLTKHGYTVKAIEVMDASRRTTKLNAYFTGFGKMKTIVLYDNLVNALTTDEICAVFAHELGHGLHKDVLKRQIMNFGNLLLMAVLAWGAVSVPQFYDVFGFDSVNYGFAFLLIGIALSTVQPLTGIFMNAYSRKAEFRADRQAVKEGYGEHLVTGLKLLAKENFADLSPSPLLVVLEYSHPPLAERIERINNSVK